MRSAEKSLALFWVPIDLACASNLQQNPFPPAFEDPHGVQEWPSKESLYYTGPMVLSVQDQQWVREKLVQLIKEISERARNSHSEVPFCLIVDWFSLIRP